MACMKDRKRERGGGGRRERGEREEKLAPVSEAKPHNNMW